MKQRLLALLLGTTMVVGMLTGCGSKPAETSAQPAAESTAQAETPAETAKDADAGIPIIGFDSGVPDAPEGAVVANAATDNYKAGAVTQSPVSIGYQTVQLAVKAAKGESVADVDTGCEWYTKDNMDSAEIADNLYD